MKSSLRGRGSTLEKKRGIQKESGQGSDEVSEIQAGQTVGCSGPPPGPHGMLGHCLTTHCLHSQIW